MAAKKSNFDSRIIVLPGIVAGVLVITFLAWNLGYSTGMSDELDITTVPAGVRVPTGTTFNFGDRTYNLGNSAIQFTHGSYKNQALMINQSINPSDNRAAVVIAYSPGGSATFYYLAGGMLKDGENNYSMPVLLGDRIKILSVTVDNPDTHNNGIVTVIYLDRPKGAPMSSQPTIRVTNKYAFEENGNLIQVLR